MKKNIDLRHKKTLFSCLSIVSGVIGVYYTIVAAFLDPQLGFETADICFFSYLGVLLPATAIEGARFLCFKQEWGKRYVFDVISISISVAFILFINWLILSDILWTDTWMRDFFVFQGPWFIALIAKILILKYGPKKTIE